MDDDKKVTPAVGDDVTAALEAMPGAFVTSLQRNNKQIRNDRALAIAEGAQMMYKRTVEDLRQDLKKLKRERTGLLDLSPGDKLSLKLATDFNEKEFVDGDIKLGITIRETEIKLEIAEKQYQYLFGNL